MKSHKQKHHIQKSELIAYPPLKVYSLIADVKRYPEFLPWCKEAHIKDENEHQLVAELTLAFGLVKTAFTTRNRHDPGKEIRMELVEGPFDCLEGAWQFRPEKGQKTRVTLDLRFRFAEHKLETLFDAAFKKAMEQILAAFKERAHSLYGSSDSA